MLSACYFVRQNSSFFSMTGVCSAVFVCQAADHAFCSQVSSETSHHNRLGCSQSKPLAIWGVADSVFAADLSVLILISQERREGCVRVCVGGGVIMKPVTLYRLHLVGGGEGGGHTCGHYFEEHFCSVAAAFWCESWYIL